MNDKWFNEGADELRAAAEQHVDLDRDLAATLARAEAPAPAPSGSTFNRWIVGAAATTIVIAGIGALALASRSPSDSTIRPDDSTVVTNPVPNDVSSTDLDVTTTIGDGFTPTPTSIDELVPAPVDVTTTANPIAETPPPTTGPTPTTIQPNTAPAATITPMTTIDSVVFPPQFTAPLQGGFTWAVVLGAAELEIGQTTDDSPVLVAAQESARLVGRYEPSITDCDVGAREVFGFGQDSQAMTVSVYFSSEADARTATASFAQHGVDARPVEVQTFCLD